MRSSLVYGSLTRSAGAAKREEPREEKDTYFGVLLVERGASRFVVIRCNLECVHSHTTGTRCVSVLVSLVHFLVGSHENVNPSIGSTFRTTAPVVATGACVQALFIFARRRG